MTHFMGMDCVFSGEMKDGEVEGYVSWKDIEKELGVLILTGEYQSRHLVLMSLRWTDSVRMMRSLMPNIRKWNRKRQNQRLMIMQYRMSRRAMLLTEDYVSAKGMTPQETANEDRMVTQAEYGAEIEAETTEKDPSELQYITPIDYAKRIAELDEDLRDAAEILVTDCSCYTPFRAFLMDVVQSDFAFMPNKLDLIRDIALGTDNAERKAYSNNKYGLVGVLNQKRICEDQL